MNPLLMLLSLPISYFLNFDYGPYGIVLIVAMYFLKVNTIRGAILIVLLNIIYLSESWIQAFSLLALPIIILHKNGFLKMERDVDGDDFYPFWRKYFFYAYYPLHLATLYIIKVSFS